MATLWQIAEVFTRAWALAQELDDDAAQARLYQLRHQSLALPDDRQAHILEEVAALTRQLQDRRGSSRPAPPTGRRRE